jgi:DNA-binding NtrC family response regulator
MALRVLVVDDDQGLRTALKGVLLCAQKYEVEEAFDGIDAVEKVKKHSFDVVILDVDMPRLSGLEALKQIKALNPETIVLIMTAFATIDSAVQAVKDGAYNYLAKPVSGDELILVLEKAVEAHRLISNVAVSAPILMEQGRKIIGNTAQMQKVFSIIDRVSKVDTPVLIRGASGTGKEVVAKAIHFNSARKDEKFVAVNCSAVPENLFESEFFGHEKGSFTGADQRKIGKFQFAEGGTLFLDEVGDLPLHMQVKLLRVLQEKVFTPVGSLREIQTNVRIIAATNRTLEDMIKQGLFREDLFYRLNVIPIFLPQLSERRDDIPTMINLFVRKFNQVHSKKVTGVEPAAMQVLIRYDWPGNIRELENVIEHAFVMENTQQITLSSLPEFVLQAVGITLKDWSEALALAEDPAVTSPAGSFQSGLGLEFAEESEEDFEHPAGASISDPTFDFNMQKEAFEKDFIIRALKAFRGRINQTALHANIPKKTLLRKIEKYGINAKDYTL